jgi:hypothetical protein
MHSLHFLAKKISELSRILIIEDGSDILSRNVGKKLPLILTK